MAEPRNLISSSAAWPAELVVIDTLLSVLQPNSRRDILRSDYQEINALSEIAKKHDTAIVIVHHLRKSSADYGLDAVAGTTGLTAAADAVWTLKRGQTGDCVLEVTGREMEEKVYGLRLVSEKERVFWRLMGEGPEMALSEERQEIVELLKEEAPLKPGRIAGMLRKNPVAVRRLIAKLYADGHIQKNRDGSYGCASNIAR